MDKYAILALRHILITLKLFGVEMARGLLKNKFQRVEWSSPDKI